MWVEGDPYIEAYEWPVYTPTGIPLGERPNRSGVMHFAAQYGLKLRCVRDDAGGTFLRRGKVLWHFIREVEIIGEVPGVQGRLQESVESLAERERRETLARMREWEEQE